MNIQAAVLALSMLVQGDGAPAPAARPHLLAVPNAEAMAKLYPIDARKLWIEGDAVISCVAVASSGSLTDCKVKHEWPEGYGFGDAAVKLSRLMRTAGEGPWSTRINFRMATDEIQICLPGSELDCILAAPLNAQHTVVMRDGSQKIVSLAIRCRLDGAGRLAACGIPADGDAKVYTPAIDGLVKGVQFPPLPQKYAKGWTTFVVNLIPADPGATAAKP